VAAGPLEHTGTVPHDRPMATDRVANRAAGLVADVVVLAEQLLTGPVPDACAVAELAGAIGALPGVQSVELAPVPAGPAWHQPPPAPAGAARLWPARPAGSGPTTVLVPSQAGPAALQVLLCGPGDPGWLGGRHLSRLRAVLALIDQAGEFVRPARPIPRPRPAGDGGGDPEHGLAAVLRLHHERRWEVLLDSLTPSLGYQKPGGRPGWPAALLHPDDRAPAWRALVRARRCHGEPQRVTVRVRPAAGGWRTVHLCCVGRSGSVVVHAVDVTAGLARSQRVAARLARLVDIVAGVGFPVVIDDERGRPWLVNDTFTQTFGAPAPHAGTGSWDAAVRDAVLSSCRDQHAVRDQLSELLPNPPVRHLIELTDGRHLELNVLEVNENEGDTGRLWFFRDMTDNVRVQRDQQASNEALADNAEARTQFVATVSHELRTPLTVIVSFASMLAESVPARLTDEQVAMVEVISRNADRLLRLVTDLLLLSRLGRMLPLYLAMTDLPRLVTAVVSDSEPEARAQRVTIAVRAADGPPLLCDPVRLHQVLANLVSNAIKYNRPGGRVEIRAECDGRSWLVEVSDTGIGIPAGELDGITETFARGSNALSRRIAGNGLGLAICREIADLHRGELSVGSTVDVGTTVALRLPLGALDRRAG
jgi:signal transduction histidine kinase